ncbi:MAG: hypothetical protein DWQ01_06140 [Planctomycetota bacterium]|nr:MAG: hypothetical protein DWQ01_06140 [Planctomycetota bacterium]
MLLATLSWWSLPIAAAVGGGVVFYFFHRSYRQGRRRWYKKILELETFQEAVQYLEEGVLLLGRRNQVLYANPAAKTLLGAEDQDLSRQYATLSKFAGSPALTAAVAYGNPEETVRRVITEGPTGAEHRVIQLTLLPARKNHRVLLLQDMLAVEKLDRKRRDFVANASHELQTPISVIIGMLDLAETVSDEDRPNLLERARHNAEALAQLTRDLLTLAKAQDPDWKPSPETLLLKEAVDRVIDTCRPKAEEKGLDLSLLMVPEDLKLMVDPLSFETVLVNLVVNAVTYTEVGQVEVHIQQENTGGVVLEVKDTGPGIDPEIQARIFERFFRGDPARSRASGGTGLGLSIVRNLLGRMGGRISVFSRPGFGTRFRVELPANPARPLPGAGQTDFS